ncbi:hypothetical protein AAC387_Pa05g0307 [Persea americana]
MTWELLVGKVRTLELRVQTLEVSGKWLGKALDNNVQTLLLNVRTLDNNIRTLGLLGKLARKGSRRQQLSNSASERLNFGQQRSNSASNVLTLLMNILTLELWSLVCRLYSHGILQSILEK